MGFDVEKATLLRALKGLVDRFDGLRRCPDCEANLEEQGDHAAGCPLALALAVMKEPRADIYALWVEKLEAVSKTAADLVAQCFVPVGSMMKCEQCQHLTTDGGHKPECPMKPLSDALTELAKLNDSLL